MKYELYDYKLDNYALIKSNDKEGFIKSLKERMSFELANWLVDNTDLLLEKGATSLQEDLEIFANVLQTDDLETISNWLKNYWSAYAIKVEY